MRYIVAGEPVQVEGGLECQDCRGTFFPKDCFGGTDGVVLCKPCWSRSEGHKANWVDNPYVPPKPERWWLG